MSKSTLTKQIALRHGGRRRYSHFLACGALIAAVVAAVLAPSAALAAPKGAAMIGPGYLSTSGNQIVDSRGRAVRFACVGGMGSAYVGGHLNYNYRPYKTLDQTIAAMNRFGFNCIRADFNNNNLADPTIMAEFDQLVAACKLHGLKVILCHHNDEATSANWGNVAQQTNGLWFDKGPGTNGTDGGGDRGTITAEKFLQDWVSVAKRYAGNSTVIGFDLDNEPVEGNGYGCNWGKGGPDDIAVMYTTVGNAIQRVNPGALIICEGPIYQLDKSSPFWCSMDLSGVAARPIVLRVPHKVVYSVHEYAKEISAVPFDSGSALVNRMNKSWGYLETKNIAPVWIGEMGMPSNAGDADAIGFEKTIIPYINGQDGSEEGPTFHGSRQPIGTDTWRWGSQPDTGDGCMDLSGQIRPAIAEYVNALLFRPKGR